MTKYWLTIGQSDPAIKRMRKNGSKNLLGNHRGPIWDGQEHKKLSDEERMDLRHLSLFPTN